MLVCASSRADSGLSPHGWELTQLLCPFFFFFFCFSEGWGHLLGPQCCSRGEWLVLVGRVTSWVFLGTSQEIW